MTAPYAVHADGAEKANWSAELEELHESSSRDHFIDVLTRRRLLETIAPNVRPGARIADLGCSSGYLLADLRRAHPTARLLDVDLVASGLRRAHELVPDAELLLADAAALPIAASSLDAVVSANLLEHMPDDEVALREVARTLKPGGIAAFVVPAGPNLFDYYDRFRGHERRYARGELARRSRSAGLAVQQEDYLGTLIYPAFWAKKKWNRRTGEGLAGAALETRVRREIAGTQRSALGPAAGRAEGRLSAAGLRLPFGIREIIVTRREPT